MLLTVRVGGDADTLGRRARSIAVDGQHANRVLRELVKSVHLVAESAHLHTLPTDMEESVTSTLQASNSRWRSFFQVKCVQFALIYYFSIRET